MPGNVIVRQAATVVLIQPIPGVGFSVFMQRRPPTMIFAAGHYVFPGGALEPGEDAIEAALRETEEETGVVLQPSDLHAWARWVTPVGEVRRYDTMFFVAELPTGQEPVPVGTEMDAVIWLSPAAALQQFADGVMPLMQPTEVTLRELSVHRDFEAVLAAVPSRDLTPVRP